MTELKLHVWVCRTAGGGGEEEVYLRLLFCTLVIGGDGFGDDAIRARICAVCSVVGIVGGKCYVVFVLKVDVVVCARVVHWR